jgi:hypothetical protein
VATLLPSAQRAKQAVPAIGAGVECKAAQVGGGKAWYATFFGMTLYACLWPREWCPFGRIQLVICSSNASRQPWPAPSAHLHISTYGTKQRHGKIDDVRMVMNLRAKRQRVVRNVRRGSGNQLSNLTD